MRKRILVLAIVLVGLLAILFTWRNLNQGEQRQPTPDTLESRQNNQGHPQSLKPDGPTNWQTIIPTTVPERTADESLRIATESKNVPIHFWGKVVDENDAPLSGVNVRARIRQWDAATYLSMSRKFDNKETITDAKGLFELKDSKGDVLAIESLVKEGYEPEPMALRSFGYNISTNISPDPKNPIVLRMWKSGTAQQLATGRRSLVPVPDGRPYTINLVTGAISESGGISGDVRFWVRRPAEIAFGQRYDWEWGIEVINGGLQEEPDRTASMYLAPEGGYKADFKMSRKVADESWGNGVADRRFYVKTHDGRINGRFNIDVYAYYSARTPARVWIKYWINPSGSRVLR